MRLINTICTRLGAENPATRGWRLFLEIERWNLAHAFGKSCEACHSATMEPCQFTPALSNSDPSTVYQCNECGHVQQECRDPSQELLYKHALSPLGGWHYTMPPRPIYRAIFAIPVAVLVYILVS